MAVSVERPAEDGATASAPPVKSFPLPYLGRTARIVGPVANVDPNQMPHPRNMRGELGKALFNWAHNTVSPDPLGRVAFNWHAADQRNSLMTVLQQLPKGQVNSQRTPVPEPAAMARHIKRVGHYMGADIVRIGATHPAFMYGGRIDDSLVYAAADTPEERARKYPFVIIATVAWDYDLAQAHRHHVGDAAYDFTLMQTRLILGCLEGYIRELGYNVLRGGINPHAVALASGVGELGRNGLIITEKFGPRVHLTDTLMTDLPLVADQPIDIGVEDFCKVCRKCAINCPTNSIGFEGKETYNGVEKYKIKWETCYKIRPYTVEHWSQCLTCSTVCPYTKPNVWWRDLAIRALRITPIPLRPALVHTLKWIDDRVWGVTGSKRVRWLWYDTGVKPGERACTVAGCTAQHADMGGARAVAGKLGYYAPLKENTTRFVRRGGVRE